MFTDDATEGQEQAIYRLLDRKRLTRASAERILKILDDLHDANGDGLDLGWMKTEVNEARRHEQGTQGEQA